MSTTRLILERCALRHWRISWRQQVALMLILALGSGVYLAMRLANRAALSGFEQFTSGMRCARKSDQRGDGRQVTWGLPGVG